MIRNIAAAVILIACCALTFEARQSSVNGIAVDVDFYTGPISQSIWLKMRESGVQYAVAQAWGGRSRNEFAASQLADARLAGGMQSGAYVLLNYDDKVCPTFAKPVRDGNGSCLGKLIQQAQPGGRWQVRQGLSALGSELRNIAFLAIDVEWFTRESIATNDVAQRNRRERILDAIDEVRKAHVRPIIYTRNAKGHWKDITGCEMNDPRTACRQLSVVINNPKTPVALWDVQTGDAELEEFQPYGYWTQRSGRQYQLDGNLFGLPASRTVDLNVFDASLFPHP